MYSNPNPEQLSSNGFAKAILTRAEMQLRRASEKLMTPEEYNEHPSVVHVFYLVTNTDAPRDPLLVDERTYETHQLRFLGRVVREITFSKDEGDISFSVQMQKDADCEVGPGERIPRDIELSSNPDGVFINYAPVELALAMEERPILVMDEMFPQTPKEGNILERLSLIMDEIELAKVI
ncbi:MAG: hypothetical protein JWO47_1008 [Candidatus Saccharibacteria bacterium]|nr:hypothetical protein [Candidatus Saccharibacteria bacterium]